MKSPHRTAQSLEKGGYLITAISIQVENAGKKRNSVKLHDKTQHQSVKQDKNNHCKKDNY